MIYRIIILSLVLTVGLAKAETREEKSARLTGRVSESILLGESPVLPEDVERRIQAIAQKLATNASMLALEKRATQQETEPERNWWFSKIQSNVVKGALICLALLVIAVVVRMILKAVAASGVDKHSPLVLVNDTLRTAPCVVTFVAASVAEALRVGRSLVDARLAARVDVLPQRALDTSQDGTLLLVQTVKGRLKALKDVLKEHALDQSALSIPVWKGHADYLNWIADAADGRG